MVKGGRWGVELLFIEEGRGKKIGGSVRVQCGGDDQLLGVVLRFMEGVSGRMVMGLKGGSLNVDAS